jgi:hypothetical protein
MFLNMNDIKAIETVYNGYRFRSRLEARWAVFFDTLGIKYEYEPEGYDIDGVWYLPDFWLPDFGIYCEVKPVKADFSKAIKFAEVTKKMIMLCEGLPDFRSYICYFWRPSNDESDTKIFLDSNEFVINIRRNRLWSVCGEIFECENHFEPKYVNGVKAARQARFEHGENGTAI